MIEIRKDENGNFRTIDGRLVYLSGQVEKKTAEVSLEVMLSHRGNYNLLARIKDLPKAQAYYIAKKRAKMKDPFLVSLTDTITFEIEFYPGLEYINAQDVLC